MTEVTAEDICRLLQLLWTQIYYSSLCSCWTVTVLYYLFHTILYLCCRNVSQISTYLN